MSRTLVLQLPIQVVSAVGRFPATVTSVTESEITAVSPAGAALPLPLGEQVELVVALARQREPLSVIGQIVYRGTSAEAEEYRFSVSEAAASLLLNLFRRRNAFRVIPARPVRLALRPADDALRVEATLRDISISGLAALVPREHEQALSGASTLHVELHLSRDEGPVRAVGQVKNRTLIESNIRIGMVFDEEASPDWPRTAEKLANFVTQTQAELLRRLRQSRGEP